MKQRTRRGTILIGVASGLAGLGVVLTSLSGPGIHPVEYGTTTNCNALVPLAIRQYSQAAFNARSFSAITDVTTVADHQQAFYAGSGSVTTDDANEYTVLVCHGTGALKAGGTHPVQWELQFDATSQASSLGVEEVSH
jgi:hypothetical protein